MATFDDRGYIDQFIKNDGWLDSCLEEKDSPDNPQAIKIVEYENAFGKTAYGVVFAHDRDKDRYERESEYINKPCVIWEADSNA